MSCELSAGRSWLWYFKYFCIYSERLTHFWKEKNFCTPSADLVILQFPLHMITLVWYVLHTTHKAQAPLPHQSRRDRKDIKKTSLHMHKSP